MASRQLSRSDQDPRQSQAKCSPTSERADQRVAADDLLTSRSPAEEVGWSIGYMKAMGGGSLASAYDLETAAKAAERPLVERGITPGS
jgi:hypothetical protein